LDFEFTEEQEALRDSLRRFLAERAPIAYVRAMLGDERGTTDDVWRGLAGLGVTGMLVPEAHGGAGMGMVDLALVLEELGRTVHPGPFASSAVAAASLLTLAGDDELRSRTLPGLAAGSSVGTVALAEPGRREDWRSPATRASLTGDAWRVTGTKVHVADGVAADLVVLSAVSDDGFALFAVDTVAREGITVVPTPTLDGTRKEARVELLDAPATRLATGDAAVAATAETVDRMHVAAVVDGVGAASRALEIAVDYAKERRQFDAPIGSFQAVQHLCADMLRAVELARAAAYYACWACDAADAAERHRAATMALAFAADELYTVGAGTIQTHGGLGFTWENDAHLYYKRLLVLQETGGGTTTQLEELASIVLDG
jgi:alkylation response protein AidB-like acyl-CoA dehydrogenase